MMRSFSFFLLFLLGCNQESRKIIPIDDKNFREIVLHGDKVVAVQQFTIENGETLLNGYSKKYYNSGAIKAVAKYRMGRKDSISMEYFEDGSVAAIYNRFAGRPIGKQVEYYSNGSIKNILLAGAMDSSLFYMQCTHDGKIKFMSGVPLYSHINKMSISRGDTFRISHMVVKERFISPILNIKLINPEGTIVYDSTITKFKHYQNNHIYDFVGVFSGTGEYLYSATIKLLKENKVIVEEDILDTILVTN
ncbi:MAG TPA: hypothetical protein PL009_01205 [Flavipsychrobacter sp.]|nr:hypothetical protein [Flavipsychrobacter sp.]